MIWPGSELLEKVRSGSGNMDSNSRSGFSENAFFVCGYHAIFLTFNNLSGKTALSEFYNFNYNNLHVRRLIDSNNNYFCETF